MRREHALALRSLRTLHRAATRVPCVVVQVLRAGLPRDCAALPLD